MLLVTHKVATEDEARKAPLPPMLGSHFKWPHGLTPPMHDCVNRRFAKTISRKEIEDKEAEVERLLAEDAKAATTRWEWVDERQLGADEDEDGIDEDAEGELDDSMGYFNQPFDEGDDMDLEADLEAAFETIESPATNMETPLTTTQSGTPAVVQDSIEMDESEEEDDDDDDDDDELDDDERAQRGEHQAVLDMIAELEKQLRNREADLAKTQNRILRSRVEQQIKQYKSEIALKKSSIGIETDD
jgi:transcription initiation factor TFIID subunit 7